MTDLKIRPRTRDDDQAILDIYLQTEDVFRFTLEAFRYHLDKRARPDGKQPLIMVGEVDGQVVADTYVEPHHSGIDGVFFAEVEVDGKQRGKGYGSALWTHIEQQMLDRGVTKVYHSLREDMPVSQAFATHRGFAKTGRAQRISQLMLGETNLSGYVGIDRKMADEGIDIKTIADLDVGNETFMRELHEATNAAVADIPRTEDTWEAETYEVWRENFLGWPGMTAETYWVALRDGHPVGSANLMVTGADSVSNGLTGVSPAERHKGIARALKAKTITWARENGYERMTTANDMANAPMLSINIPLGYKPLPAREEWLKQY